MSQTRRSIYGISFIWKLRILLFLSLSFVAFNIVYSFNHIFFDENWHHTYTVEFSSFSKSSIISNNYYSKSCVDIEFNSTITDEIMYCKKEFTDVISVIGFYCNELLLYWFHRNLYSLLFLSRTIPKYIFISINNMNGEECIYYNQNKNLYYQFISYITKYFNGNTQIFIYFIDKLISDSAQRNFLIGKINDFSSLIKTYNDNIIIHIFDGDDIHHPQKFEIIDYFYSNQNNLKINGTMIFSYIREQCRFWNNKTDQILYHKLKYKNFNGDFVLQYFNKYYINKFQYILPKLYKNLKLIKVTSDTLPLIGGDIKDYQRWYRYQDSWAHALLGNGWPILTLNSVLTNPYNETLAVGQDINFNLRTIHSNYDYYICKLELGIYCQGAWQIKLNADQPIREWAAQEKEAKLSSRKQNQ